MSHHTGNQLRVPLRVLLAEDNPVDAELVVRELVRAGFELDWKRVDNEVDFTASLHADLDIILSDFEMPAFSGLRALDILKQSGLEIPFIIVSGMIGEETAVAAMQQGAADYLLKDRLVRLGPAVKHALEKGRMRLQRKQAERALRSSEERYRALFDCAPDGIIITDLGSNCLDVNASICRMLGRSREEMVGLHASQIMIQSEIRHIAPAVHEIQSKSDYKREWQFQRKDGSTFPAEVIATLMPDGNLLAMVRDVTERKRSEGRFRQLVDCNAQGVMFRKVTGEITSANDAFLQIVGYSREDLEAGLLDWIGLTPGEYAGLDRRSLEEIADHGVGVPYEKEFFRKDGSRAPVLVATASFEDNPDEGVCFVLDLTERKKLEQQFLRAQRMESIGTLAGGIAHDLNNVLAPIIMSLDLLKMKFNDPASKELLSVIGSSAQRGADMVGQVLSFARGVEVRRIELKVGDLIQGIEGIVTELFFKNIRLRSVVPPGLWPILGDPTQLHQVLLNLCVNARDAMPNGGSLTISAENFTITAPDAGLPSDAVPGNYVFIQIEDSGTGMPSEVREQIFDPFFTTKEVGKGTGLGLSTSLAIVKSHGGFFRVESEVGQGTRFQIFLPAQTVTTTDSAEYPITDEMPRGHGELILFVDDEASVREITYQTLEAFGYHVVLASDGAEAVAIYGSRGAEIAAVITDMSMPLMDGPTTIRVLRGMNPQVRIIATSGLSGSAVGANLGISHFLPKPYTAETLLRELHEILQEENQETGR
ncbi:MAG TPA: PAS domain S-box protein [Luteolibacter sp.]